MNTIPHIDSFGQYIHDIKACWITISPYFFVLLMLEGADIILGFGNAIVTKSVNSAASIRGLTKKCMMLVAVLTCLILDPLTMGFDPAKVAAVGFWGAEGLSIVENLSGVGIRVTWLTQFFNRLQAPPTAIKIDTTDGPVPVAQVPPGE